MTAQFDDRLTAADFADFAGRLSGAVTKAEDTRASQLFLQVGKSTAPSFDDILLAYMREYVEGKFVNRFGAKLPAPELSGGIPTATIVGAATVFFEALYDTADHLPIVADKKWPGEEKPTKFYAGGGGFPTALVAIKADENDKETYGPIKTLVAGEDKDECGITEREARALGTLSNYVAKRAVIWSGGLLEALSNINVGFIVLPGFAIGDNKTLVDLARASIETVMRRSAEHAFYEVFYRVPQRNLGPFIDLFPKILE